MSINDIRAGIPLQVVGHIASQLEANPDTGGIRFQAPVTADEPYPDYGEKAAEAARLFGRISDRVFPIGKSYSQGEFGQGGNGEEDDTEYHHWDDSTDDEFQSEEEDFEPDVESANRQNKPKSNPNSRRMARKFDESPEPDWNRRSNSGSKRVGSDFSGPFDKNQRNKFSDGNDRRNGSPFASRYKEQRNFPRKRKPVIRHRYGHYGDEEDVRNGPFYYNERTDEFEYGEPKLVGESSRKVASSIKRERQRRTDGYRTVRFRTRRAGKNTTATESASPATTSAADNSTPATPVITITDDDEEEEKPKESTKPRRRVVTPFRLPKGTTTAATSSSSSDDDGEPGEGDPLDNIDNFWG